MTLVRRLGVGVELSIPGFREGPSRGAVRQLHFRERVSEEWYEGFLSTVTKARGHFPIYRMSDGEFIFACGRRPLHWTQVISHPTRFAKSWVRALLPASSFRSGSAGYGFESYSPAEWRIARDGYAARVAQLSREGILAINLVRQKDGFAREYLQPFCRWLEASGIELSDRNYYPFYFVYALLLGPDARRLLSGRRVLVVTSDEDGTKAKAIDRSLRSLGALSSTLIQISRSKSMLDRISVPAEATYDLALIGAGVGALNVIEQLRPLALPCIDAGYVLDCYWDPARFLGRRVFSMPDGGRAALGI